MSLPLVVPALPSPAPKPLATCLRDLHARRLRELREVLEPARGHEAGVWSRWAAVRFIRHLLAAWFEPERAAVEGAGSRLAVSHTVPLWMGAELVQTLGWRLDHTPGLCHQPAEFGCITLKLETILEHWCREVEEAFTPLGWSDLSNDQGLAFAVFAGEEQYHVT